MMWRAPVSPALVCRATRTWASRATCRFASAAAVAKATRREPEDRNVMAARTMLGATGEWKAHEAAKRAKTLGPLRGLLQDHDKAQKLADELARMCQEEADDDLRSIASSDLEALRDDTLPSILSRLRDVLTPVPKSHAGSALLEVRLAVGGAESAHFAADLLAMYLRLCARRGWRANVVMQEDMMSGQGRDGVREAAVEVQGEGAYGGLRWEAGVHRVQRVPVLQNTSSVHTSTASVLVLPLAPDEGDDEPLFDDKDVRIDTMRAGGAGGQHVNKTESAIRLTHLPTGITVSMQDSRSQAQNRVKAFTILKARLLDRKFTERAAAESAARRAQVRTGQRSEKIRTYNFQQGRITDHRIPMTLPRLGEAMEGGQPLDLFQEALDELERDERIDAILEGDIDL